MAGFQHCKFCQGTGCWGCNGERRKYEKRQTERIKNWSPPSEKEIDLAKSILSQINPDMSPEDMEQVEASMKLPPPILTIRLDDNSTDMDAVRELLGGDALRKMAEEPDDFHDRFLEKAEEFRVKTGIKTEMQKDLFA